MYCGFCGTSLSDVAARTGRCPNCGAIITMTGNVIDPGKDTEQRKRLRRVRERKVTGLPYRVYRWIAIGSLIVLLLVLAYRIGQSASQSKTQPPATPTPTALSLQEYLSHVA
jgi:hypothetical protein